MGNDIIRPERLNRIGRLVGVNSSGSPLPTEQVTINFTKATSCYVVINKDTGAKEGQIETKYDKEAAKAG